MEGGSDPKTKGFTCELRGEGTLPSLSLQVRGVLGCRAAEQGCRDTAGQGSGTSPPMQNQQSVKVQAGSAAEPGSGATMPHVS